jgi:hypothetical protein
MKFEIGDVVEFINEKENPMTGNTKYKIVKRQTIYSLEGVENAICGYHTIDERLIQKCEEK